uniref:Uncharacterized protein n=1 Tax=Aegilops tauschii subsp. strangulata TaxID=200361 RepID=A0A453RBD2_AEGTS
MKALFYFHFCRVEFLGEIACPFDCDTLKFCCLLLISYLLPILQLITVHDEAWLEKEEARVRQVFEEVAEDIKKEKAAKLAEAIKEEKAAKLAKAIKENALKEVNEATEVGTIGHGHGKSAKYVVPARRK